MAKTHTPKIAPNGRYRVNIGGRNFWLGKDQQVAIKVTNYLTLAWQNETTTDAQGKKTWSDKQIEWAFNGCGLNPPTNSDDTRVATDIGRSFAALPLLRVSRRTTCPLAWRRFRPSGSADCHEKIDRISAAAVCRRGLTSEKEHLLSTGEAKVGPVETFAFR